MGGCDAFRLLDSGRFRSAVGVDDRRFGRRAFAGTVPLPFAAHAGCGGERRCRHQRAARRSGRALDAAPGRQRDRRRDRDSRRANRSRAGGERHRFRCLRAYLGRDEAARAECLWARLSNAHAQPLRRQGTDRGATVRVAAGYGPGSASGLAGPAREVRAAALRQPLRTSDRLRPRRLPGRTSDRPRLAVDRARLPPSEHRPRVRRLVRNVRPGWARTPGGRTVPFAWPRLDARAPGRLGLRRLLFR